jgi:hypothetical protein
MTTTRYPLDGKARTNIGKAMTDLPLTANRCGPRGRRTGERFYDLVRAEMPDKVIHAAVGARFVFGCAPRLVLNARFEPYQSTREARHDYPWLRLSRVTRRPL